MHDKDMDSTTVQRAGLHAPLSASLTRAAMRSVRNPTAPISPALFPTGHRESFSTLLAATALSMENLTFTISLDRQTTSSRHSDYSTT